MPASLRSHAVTSAYRERLRGIRTRAEQRAEALWPAIQELDTTDWVDRVAALLTQAQTEAVRASAGYLSAYLTSELGTPATGPVLDSREFAGRSRDGRPLSESLHSPLIGVRAALKGGATEAEALSAGLVRAKRMVEMDLMAAARDSLQEGMKRDERIVGWQRSVNGTCGACLGDISVEVSVQMPGIPLRIHPNCLCQTVPVVTGVRDLFPLPSGREVFKRMTKDEQDAQFGPEKADALRAGDLSLDDLVASSPLVTQENFITEKPLNAAR